MSGKTNFKLFLTAFLLMTEVNELKWQGTGNMNNSVITKIWENLYINLNTAVQASSLTNIMNALTKDISDRLNTYWNHK